MKIFLDTANLDSIKRFSKWGVVDGITTNPSLIAKEGVELEQRIREIVALVQGPISVEVLATRTEEMVKEGRKYASWAQNIVVKIPITEDGLKAIRILSDEGIAINTTLIFTPAQALLAAKAGSTYVSPFIGRLDDQGENGLTVVQDIVSMFQHMSCQLLVASVRTITHVVESAKMGADCITLPPQILQEMLSHPLTTKGLEQFLNDYKKVFKEA